MSVQRSHENSKRSGGREQVAWLGAASVVRGHHQWGGKTGITERGEEEGGAARDTTETTAECRSEERGTGTLLNLVVSTGFQNKRDNIVRDSSSDCDNFGV